MNRLQLILRSAVLGLAIALAGLGASCGDEAAAPSEIGTDVLITPEIHVTGLEQLDDGVAVQDLFLGIGEIRLEPVDDPTEVVYVTREPLFLHFDIASGQWSMAGPPLLLPRGGEYLVSLRMDSSANGDDQDSSMRIDGLYADLDGNRSFLDANSIEPTPLPMRTAQGGLSPRGDNAVTWVPWTYSTTRTVNIVLNNVDFDGDQTLVINFDLSAWIMDVIDPISAEVLARTSEVELPDQANQWPEGAPAIDVSEIIDDSQGGLEHLGAWSEAFSG